ncbi:MAG: hypothetical protein ACJAYC_002213 [Halieaceae bacterium]
MTQQKRKLGVNRASKIVTPLLAAFCMVLMSSTAMAESTYYRWADERGQSVHSDRPPPAGTDYEVVSTGSSLTRQVAGDEGAVPAETIPRVGNQFDQVDLEPEDIKKDPEYCERARKNLESLESSTRIKVRNDQGELRFLNEEERQAEMIKAEDAIITQC